MDIDVLIIGGRIVLVSFIKLLESTLIGVPLNMVTGFSLARMAPLTAANLPSSNLSTWPSVVETGSVGFPNGIILETTISDPEGFNKIGIPVISRPSPSAAEIVATSPKLVAVVNDWPPTVKIDECG